jgi:hypothetical protein
VVLHGWETGLSGGPGMSERDRNVTDSDISGAFRAMMPPAHYPKVKALSQFSVSRNMVLDMGKPLVFHE